MKRLIVAGEMQRKEVSMNWNPAEHATYCPQHYEPPADGGGSSWLCRCSGGDLERVAAEDRAATVHLYGEERVAELEAEANRG